MQRYDEKTMKAISLLVILISSSFSSAEIQCTSLSQTVVDWFITFNRGGMGSSYFIDAGGDTWQLANSADTPVANTFQKYFNAINPHEINVIAYNNFPPRFKRKFDTSSGKGKN
ncbi:hypothetical protein D918_02514 [Trichuris suis]|nr:hypothetical protein D918_02514 [Trichuris suis]